MGTAAERRTAGNVLRVFRRSCASEFFFWKDSLIGLRFGLTCLLNGWINGWMFIPFCMVFTKPANLKGCLLFVLAFGLLFVAFRMALHSFQNIEELGRCTLCCAAALAVCSKE